MIDWQRVFLNLRSSGMPLARVARKVGMDEGAVNRFARGVQRRDPPMTQALRVLDLHHERCPLLHTAREIGEP